MITTFILLAAISQSEDWGLPHAGKALNQNELTYFSDGAIVRVTDAQALPIEREVTTPLGKFKVECRQQDVVVLSSNFEDVSALRLVFTPHLPTSQKPMPPPGWIKLPLPPGTYFVMGRIAREGQLRAYPGFSGYGMGDASTHPKVPYVTIPSRSASEFAVFHAFATNAERLAANGISAGTVLRNLVNAATQSADVGYRETMSLLLRTGHDAFPDWQKAATVAREELARYGRSTSGSRKAIALVTAFKMGSDSYKFDLESEMLTALVEAGRQDRELWTGADFAQELYLVTTINFPTPAQAARLVSEERQRSVLRLFAATDVEPIKRFVGRFLSSKYTVELNPDIVAALRSADASAESTSLFLGYLARWKGEPDRDPDKNLYSRESLISYWLSKLG